MKKEFLNIGGVYKIVNKVNGHVYIGSTVNIKKRWNRHILELKTGKHYNQYLQRAWNKYGEENFIFEVIEEVGQSDLIKQEQYWIDKGCDYNINKEATKPPNWRGKKHSEESKKKMSIIFSKRKLSKETKEKLSKINKGKKLSEETKKKISKAGIGRRHTEESKRKISESQKGEKSFSSKLTWEIVNDIRRKYQPKKFSYKKLSEEYNVSPSCIQAIIENRSWYDKEYVQISTDYVSLVRKLTFKQVKEIREKYIPKIYSQAKLAKEYNVSEGCIQKIIENRIYKDIRREI